MKVLVDGDLILYRVGFATEKTKYLVELTNPTGSVEFHRFDSKKTADEFIKNTSIGIVGIQSYIWNRKELEPVENAYSICNSTIRGIEEKYGNRITLFLSGPKNFRDQVWTTKKYKGNRDNQARPTHYEALKKFLIENYNAEVTDGIEADDAIGISMDSDSVCVSLDKDLDQLPGLHYNWVSGEEYTVSPKDAKTMFYVQLLAGDATDNIGGIPGVGVAKATKALAACANPKEMMDVAVQMYKETYHDMWKLRLEETAQLVYILRSDHDMKWFNTKDYEYLSAIRNRDIDAQAA